MSWNDIMESAVDVYLSNDINAEWCSYLAKDIMENIADVVEDNLIFNII
jgi:hypothetical protein